LVFLVVSFLLAFPPISYMHSSSPPFVLHALPISRLHKCGLLTGFLPKFFYCHAEMICSLVSLYSAFMFS
jgi:hypothetical protein